MRAPRGKDSIAVALALRDKIEVILFHYDDMPGLEFVEESLAYYEKHLFDRRILRMRRPPSFYRHLRDLILHRSCGRGVLIPIINQNDVRRMVKD